MRAVFVAVVVGLGVGVGCALFSPTKPTRLPDGSYEIKCETSLATCLAEIEKVCSWHGYDVIRATESRRRNDVREARTETITSEAVARCRRGDPLFGAPEAPLPAAMPDAGARPAPLPPPPVPPAPPPPPTFYPDAGTPSPDAGPPVAAS